MANGSIDPSTTKVHLTPKQLAWIVGSVVTLTATVFGTYIATRQSIIDLRRDVEFQRKLDQKDVERNKEMLMEQKERIDYFYDHGLPILAAYVTNLRNRMADSGIRVPEMPKIQPPRRIVIESRDPNDDENDHVENDDPPNQKPGG